MKTYDFKVGGESFTAKIVEYTETKVVVDLNGNTYDVELIHETPAAPTPSVVTPQPASTPRMPPKKQAPQPTSSTLSSGAVVAPIPGVVKQILVAVGDKVTTGTVLLLLEAMKMENQIPASVDGTVTEISIGMGDTVDEGQLLIQIEAS